MFRKVHWRLGSGAVFLVLASVALVGIDCGAPESLKNVTGNIGGGGNGGTPTGGTTDTGGTGGATDTGGTGGATDLGGSGGATDTGGSTGTGGSTATGGATGNGGSTGTGGSTANGGTTGSGGSTANGGTTGSGGTTAAGGTTGSGGGGAGGTTASGGTTGSGGTGGSASMVCMNSVVVSAGGSEANCPAKTTWKATANPTPASNFDGINNMYLQPQYAIDGMAATRYSSGATLAANFYFQVDLGVAKTVSGITVDTNVGTDTMDVANGYDVSVSTDGTNFTVVKSCAYNAAPTEVINFASTTARYIRYINKGAPGPGNGPTSWMSIHEFDIICH
ncbi:MAG TPA: discoidin domain-containing protein [Polyangia bacterium]|nr:discoidin domain-containing protein [Polyangia bacterium]